MGGQQPYPGHWALASEALPAKTIPAPSQLKILRMTNPFVGWARRSGQRSRTGARRIRQDRQLGWPAAREKWGMWGAFGFG
jgi:hypothetical protein